MGPRLVSRGNTNQSFSSLPESSRLQWGRGLLAAEMGGLHKSLGIAKGKLQWGRGLLAAEI